LAGRMINLPRLQMPVVLRQTFRKGKHYIRSMQRSLLNSVADDHHFNAQHVFVQLRYKLAIAWLIFLYHYSHDAVMT
jgi:hypothetical protein